MAKKFNIDTSDFDKEYELMEETLKELNELYDETKETISKSVGTRANNVFISNQTSNLVSIKKEKLNILKEMVGIKKDKKDLQLKEYNINAKEGLNGGDNNEIIKSLFNMLINKDYNELKESSIENNEEEITLTDSEIEDMLEARLNEDENKEVIINKIPENKNERVVVDINRNLYVIDNDYNLLEKYSIDISNIVIEEFENDENGEQFAIDTEGNKYEVVEFEEE